MILGANGEKMSKSRGNVVNPDDVVDELGADAFRLYEMFMAPLTRRFPGPPTAPGLARRFLDRLWRLMENMTDEPGISEDMAYDVHATIKKSPRTTSG
jgi:leucyl-tRNA synthetase